MTFPSLPQDRPETLRPTGTYYWDDPDSEYEWVVSWSDDQERVILEDPYSGVQYDASDFVDSETEQWLYEQIGD